MIGGSGKTESEGQKVLDPSMIVRRQMATLLELWPTNKGIEDGRKLFIFQLHENGTAQSSPRIQKSDTNFRRTLEPGLELVRPPVA